MLKKLSAKSWTPGDFFCPPRAFSHKSLIFDQSNRRNWQTNQIKIAGSRPQSHGDAINMELSTMLLRFYQQQQQQTQLLQQQQPQQQIMHENESCDDEDLNETNRIENSFIN